MQDRLAAHDELATWFDERTDGELIDLVGSVEATPGWGMSRTIDLDGRQVFVKTIPLTDLEIANPGATHNLYGLPLVYHYGVGSAGFGAHRELAAHVKTTAWVRNGAIDNFPLLHHHRVLPLAGQTRRMDPERLERYVAYWDGHDAVRRFIHDRERSTWAIAMFSEHVPHTMQHWLPHQQSAIVPVIEQGLEVRAFLPGPERTVEFGTGYQQALTPFRSLIDEMSAVFGRLATGSKTSGGYDDDRLAKFLAEAMSAPVERSATSGTDENDVTTNT